MSQSWVIYNKSNGAAIQIGHMTADAQTPPNAATYDGWNGNTMAAVAINGYDEARQSWNPVTKALEENLAKVQAIVVDQIKRDNESLVRSLLSTHDGKENKYAAKQQEVLSYDADGVTDKLIFSSAQAELRSNLTGKPVDVESIINEYKQAIATDQRQLAVWEAIELENIRLVNLASTADEVRTIYANINWD